MEETYPPPSSTDPYHTALNPKSIPAQGGEQNQSHPQGEAAGYYNNAGAHEGLTYLPMTGGNVGYGQEGQQQQPQGEKDNKNKAIELAKKGWAMYKENKNKTAA